MSLVFGQAQDILAQYQGKGGKAPTDRQSHDFTLKVLQYLLISGSPNTERVFRLIAQNRKVTLPYELETPLKVKINGRVGTVGNKFFSYYSGPNGFGPGSFEASNTLFEDPNNYCTVYDIPHGGSRVGVMGTVDEDTEKCPYIIVSGKDTTGREIFTNHKGAQISGELLEIRKGIVTWSNVDFSTITGVMKLPTKGYTPLFWKQNQSTGFLADYTPSEEIPSYRRIEISADKCSYDLAQVDILGRVRLKRNYAYNDEIPFDNLYTIEVAGQQVNLNYNNDNQVAAQKDNFLMTLTDREANYKKVNNGQALEVYHPLSGGTLKGILD